MTSKLPSTARSLPFALIRAREGAVGPIREMLAKSGMTEQQWRVIRVLAEYGPLDASTLAERAALSLPSQTRIVKNMQDKGLLTGTPDPKDRRRQVLALTQAGQEVLDDKSSLAADIVTRYQQILGAQDYETLLDLLERLDPNRR